MTVNRVFTCFFLFKNESNLKNVSVKNLMPDITHHFHHNTNSDSHLFPHVIRLHHICICIQREKNRQVNKAWRTNIKYIESFNGKNITVSIQFLVVPPPLFWSCLLNDEMNAARCHVKCQTEAERNAHTNKKRIDNRHYFNLSYRFLGRDNIENDDVFVR